MSPDRRGQASDHGSLPASPSGCPAPSSGVSLIGLSVSAVGLLGGLPMGGRPPGLVRAVSVFPGERGGARARVGVRSRLLRATRPLRRAGQRSARPHQHSPRAR
jgi:hypothetical protein